MRKYFVWIAACTVLWAAAVYPQEDMTRIDNSVFPDPVRDPAVFVHDAHNEKAGIDECNTCHHIYTKGKIDPDESSEDRRCADCHPVQSVEDRPRLIKAFHQQCKFCHNRQKTGPIMCGECHRKEDGASVSPDEG